MDLNTVIDGLIMYLGLVVLLTFHEFGHAWMAWKCGDDTAKLQGRCSLNPLVHIDPIGTVLMPLLMIFTSPTLARFMIGWAKPVPVNAANLRNPKLDDILVTLAGPWMNLMLAVILIGAAKVARTAGYAPMVEFCLNSGRLSLVLFFFNLIPIPPLDGSHIVRVLLGISYQTYWQFARFGFVAVIVVMQFDRVQGALDTVTRISLNVIKGWFGL